MICFFLSFSNRHHTSCNLDIRKPYKAIPSREGLLLILWYLNCLIFEVILFIGVRYIHSNLSISASFFLSPQSIQSLYFVLCILSQRLHLPESWWFYIFTFDVTIKNILQNLFISIIIFIYIYMQNNNHQT